MVVNHGGRLKKDYFYAYLMLMMNTRECSLKQAEELSFSFFFEEDKEKYGKETYEQFLLACQELQIIQEHN